MTDKPETIPEAFPTESVDVIKQHIREYHLALDMREHNAGAAQALVKKLEVMFDMPWQQGEELQKQRAGK